MYGIFLHVYYFELHKLLLLCVVQRGKIERLITRQNFTILNK